MQEFYDYAVAIQAADDTEELLKSLRKVGKKDLLSDKTLTDYVMKTAVTELENAKKILLKESEVYVYGTEISD